MATVWIRRGFRWVAVNETDVPTGQYFVTEPPTEALANEQADRVAARMAAEPYTPRRVRPAPPETPDVEPVVKAPPQRKPGGRV